MKTITLKINTRHKQGKYLLGLIREMAKDGTIVEIKTKIVDDITLGLKQVKNIHSGELPKRGVKQLLQDQ